MRRWLLLGAGIIILLLSACDREKIQENSNQQRATKAARQAFQALANENTEDVEIWGYTKVNVFGRSNFFGDNLGIWIASGVPTIAKFTDPANSYQVIIPHWMSGTGSDGKRVHLIRQATLMMTPGIEKNTYEMKSITLSEVGGLTFWRQLRSWLTWVFLGPIAIVLAILAITTTSWSSFPLATVFRYALWGISVISIPIVLHVSAVCFGTVIGVILGFIAYSLIGYALWQLFMALLRSLVRQTR